MSLRRRAATSAVAVLSLLLGTLGLAVPAHAATSFTYLQMQGQNDYIAGNASYLYTSTDTTFTPSFSASSAYVAVVQGAYVHWWYVSLSAPTGQELVEGATYQAKRSADATYGGMDVSGDGRGCNQTTGSFTVNELGKDELGAITSFSATFEQHCEGGAGATRGTIAINASKSPATFTSTTPASAVVGGPVTVSGTLTDMAGPLADAAVTVSRPDGSGGTASFGTTTAGDGSFSVDDTMGASAVTYTLEYAGDDAHYPATKQITVASVKAASTLALSAPTSVKRGTTYSLTGTLKSGGAVVANATITLSRKDLKGTTTSTVKTSASGTFSKKDTPAVGGTVTWTVGWPGSSTQAAVTAKRSVTVPRAATSLSITTDKSLYSYGTKATVRAKLGTTYNGRTVAIYAKKATSSSWALIKKGTVSSTGYLTAYYTMTAKTSFKAVYAGDYRYAPATKYVTPSTKAKITTQVYGAYGTSNGYKLVSVFSSAGVLATVKPARNAGCVSFAAQVLVNGSWKTYDTQCFGVDYNSQAGVTLSVTGASKWRIRASVVGNSYSAAGSSGWVYLWFR